MKGTKLTFVANFRVQSIELCAVVSLCLELIPHTLCQIFAQRTTCFPRNTSPTQQVFSCHVPASEGGASTYVDGFAVAERLRKENPEAFELFTTTPITYHYFDDKHHHVSEGPLFQTDASGAVVQVQSGQSFACQIVHTHYS